MIDTCGIVVSKSRSILCLACRNSDLDLLIHCCAIHIGIILSLLPLTLERRGFLSCM